MDKKYISEIKDEEWKAELKKKTTHPHTIAVYVAIIFNPIFGATDYFNIPDSWQHVFVIRVAISLFTLGGFFLFKKGKINSFLMVAIPLVCISFQNAYTYRLIDNSHLLGHNLNYIALFLGASLFLLWPLRYSLLGIGFSVVVSFLFVASNPLLDFKAYLIEGGLLLATSFIFTILMIQSRFVSSIKEIKSSLALAKNLQVTADQKEEIQSQAQELKSAKDAIEERNDLLENYNSKLETEVEKRTEKLKRANKEMDQLVYSLSHDFRTPMVNAKGLLGLVMELPQDQMTESVHSKIEDCLESFDRLLYDMMNYAVYWNDKVEISRIDVLSVVEAVWGNLKGQHKSLLGLELEGFVDKEKWHLDGEKLRVILYCILSNSIVFQKSKIDEGKVRIKTIRTEAKIIIQVIDNGVGIKEEFMANIFDMYFRGLKTSSGAGLGLYIAKGVSEQMKADLSIESTLNEGTVVSIAWNRSKLYIENDEGVDLIKSNKPLPLLIN